ncbi:MAG: YigZ family protein [Clostridia bacterium]|nr:YigZ family protein [Clostridia bacterium]
MEGYLTVLSSSAGEYEEKRSRFIANLFPVACEEEAMSLVKELKSKYWDARHNVYAYVLSTGECRFSDDGEPHGTAGKPILDVINGKKLKNVCIVVTRYFGGVLLGTGGLVRAYSEAAKQAVINATIAEMGILGLFSVTCDYVQYNRLLPLLQGIGATVTDTVFEAEVKVSFSLDKTKKDELGDKLTDAFFGKLSAKAEGETISPVKIINNL